MTATTRLDDLVSRLLARLDAHRSASFPAIEGAPLRALPRLAWSRLGGRGPMVELDPSLLDDPPDLQDPARQAHGGWLVLLGPVDLDERGLRCAVLRADPYRPARVSAADLDRLRRADELHATTADPALGPVRRALRAYAQDPTAVIHIAGPPGVGSAALVRTAHLDADTPAALVLPGPRPAPDAWALFEEATDLDDARRGLLIERLTPPPAPPAAQPPGPARPDNPAYAAILGDSPALARALHEASRAAPTSWPVLVTGETGTGKEGLARALHADSGRAGPLIALDLGALAEELADSELFGHVRGAFTGADRPRLGAFRAAQGGTLLLDEVGNLSPRVQHKLLRVLQERSVRPVGQDEPVPVDVRVIAATSADLDSLVARGLFREDLRRRLDTFTVHLPPLRERGDDVLLLARAFLQQERPGAQLTAAACDRLRAWPWPGNVRELQAAIVRAAARTAGDVDAADLVGLQGAVSAPTFLTTSGEGQPDLRLPAALAHRATAVTLRVPAVRDRDPAHVRALLHALLDGHPIRSDALEALVGRPWWGNLTELRATLAALRRGWNRPIDRDRVAAVLPDLAARPDLRPIEVLLSPVAVGEEIDGLRARYAAGALVLGRSATLRELDAALTGPPERRAWLDAVVGAAPPALLPLRMLPDASRVQAIVARDPLGLVVHAPGWARLSVHAGPLGGPGLLTPVTQDRPVPLGPGGELQLLAPNGELRLQLFLFAGPVAAQELGPRALLRAASAPAATLHPAADPVEQASRRWVLDPAEARALINLLATHPGGEFKGWIAHTLKLLDKRPELTRLTAFLRAAPNPSDYTGRLFEYEGNEGLAPALLARIHELGDAELRLSRLPTRLRRLVDPDGAPR